MSVKGKIVISSVAVLISYNAKPIAVNLPPVAS